MQSIRNMKKKNMHKNPPSIRDTMKLFSITNEYRRNEYRI